MDIEITYKLTFSDGSVSATGYELRELRDIINRLPGFERTAQPDVEWPKKVINLDDFSWQALALMNEKICAIKRLRGLTDMGLKEAKDTVENFARAIESMGSPYKDPAPTPEGAKFEMDWHR